MPICVYRITTKFGRYYYLVNKPFNCAIIAYDQKPVNPMQYTCMHESTHCSCSNTGKFAEYYVIFGELTNWIELAWRLLVNFNLVLVNFNLVVLIFAIFSITDLIAKLKRSSNYFSCLYGIPFACVIMCKCRVCMERRAFNALYNYIPFTF